MRAYGEGASAMDMRMPPQNLEAERAVLGAALLAPKVLHEISQILAVDDFYRDSHQIIYRRIRELYDAGLEVSGVSLADLLERNGELKKVGADKGIFEIANSVPHAANAVYHAHIVQQKAVTRKLIQACTEIITDGYSNQFTADQLVEAAEQRIFGLRERGERDSSRSAEEVIAAAFMAITSRSPGEPRGLSTGFHDLDYVIDGLKKQDFIILAARPSMGKSALAGEIAVNVAAENGRVLFVSIEMNSEALGERMISARSGVGGYALREPWKLEAHKNDAMCTAAQALGALSLWFDDRPSRSVSQIAAEARRRKAKDGLDLIVIDYLSLIEGQRQRGESRQDEVAGISRRLKSLARELDCPVICLHQLNRGVESRDGHRPRISDLRESGQIEQDADVVMLLHRPEYYDANERPGQAEVIVAKNRNGAVGSVYLQFTKECTRFAPLAETSDF